ncbi:MAG: hypothetical protein EBZ11_04165, partial [Alphaproteobacteria bacterium]|nr:hypothetical protein [Alphaproteobacteria bacterium]
MRACHWQCAPSSPPIADVFFYEVALKTGIRKIKNMAHRLGLGEVTGLGLPGEKQGIIPSHEWKLANLGKVWT